MITDLVQRRYKNKVKERKREGEGEIGNAATLPTPTQCCAKFRNLTIHIRYFQHSLAHVAFFVSHDVCTCVFFVPTSWRDGRLASFFGLLTLCLEEETFEIMFCGRAMTISLALVLCGSQMRACCKLVARIAFVDGESDQSRMGGYPTVAKIYPRKIVVECVLQRIHLRKS